jgi:hypothetical protein
VSVSGKNDIEFTDSRPVFVFVLACDITREGKMPQWRARGASPRKNAAMRRDYKQKQDNAASNVLFRKRLF